MSGCLALQSVNQRWPLQWPMWARRDSSCAPGRRPCLTAFAARAPYVAAPYDETARIGHVTLYRWVQRFKPLLIDASRPVRHMAGDRWFVDLTYVKVAGV
jgi:hypothetical protein